MRDKAHKPIYSVFDDDVEMRETISEFVVGLAERVDLLQDAECGGGFAELESLATALLEEAQRLGFSPLEAVSKRVVDACQDEKAGLAQKALVELTDLARRIRLGHRGAA